VLRRELLQLVAGLLVAGFLLLHLWQFRVRLYSGAITAADFGAELAASLSSTAFGGVPVMAIVYLVGLAAAAFHFAHGLHGVCRTWGIVLTERAGRVSLALFTLAGVSLFTIGAATVIYLATGSVSLPSVAY
jgi:succinate dehydrogenase / fumarate reductase cytochrome b subunit